MKLRNVGLTTALCALLISAGAFATVYTAEMPDKDRNGRAMDCEMKFNLQRLSALYETAMGEGMLVCNNGQIAKLSIRATGGGLMFGRFNVVDGTGKFSDARTVGELFGSYVQAEVHAVAGDAAAVQVLTKGRISLVLAGTSRNEDFGFAFEKFTIDRANYATLSHD